MCFLRAFHRGLLATLVLLSLPQSVPAQSLKVDEVYPRFGIGVTGIYATIENLEVVVSDVAPGSPAELSGLVAGDILTSVSGQSLAVADPRRPLGEALGAAEASKDCINLDA